MLIAAIYFGGLGLIVGSFLNVLVLRRGVMSLHGRSACPSCGKTIWWYDNIPVLSWIMLRGRCRYCGSSISLQYPLVEALTSGLFVAVGLAGFPEYLFSLHAALMTLGALVIVSLLVAITVYDMRHTIIPDEWSYSFGALALCLAFVQAPNIWTVISGPVAAIPLFFLWLVSRGRWMGLGDPKLALGIGWLVGIPLGVIAIFASFIIGSLVLLPLLAYERLVTHKGEVSQASAGLTMKSEVPFGPFLIASCLLFWFAQLYGIALPLSMFGL
jgi:leader peptidase (prepilin peptidase)/N-methyltransferase